MTDQLQSKPLRFIVRILSTAAIWSIASVVSARLRHPTVYLTMAALAAGLSVMIWSYRFPNNGGE